METVETKISNTNGFTKMAEIPVIRTRGLSSVEDPPNSCRCGNAVDRHRM